MAEGLTLRRALQAANTSKGDGVSNAIEPTLALIGMIAATEEYRRPDRSLSAGSG